MAVNRCRSDGLTVGVSDGIPCYVLCMTERLYFVDPYLRGFSAQVVARKDWEIPASAAAPLRRYAAVALDRTAFYPEGGGQPADRGLLNEVRVVDVQTADDGT